MAKARARQPRGVSGRGRCPQYVRDTLLANQDGRCAYCGLRFGSLIRIDGKLHILVLEFDHFYPYNRYMDRPADNWVASCDVCNKIKGNAKSGTVPEAVSYVRDLLTKREHHLVTEDPEDLYIETASGAVRVGDFQPHNTELETQTAQAGEEPAEAYEEKPRADREELRDLQLSMNKKLERFNAKTKPSLGPPAP